jgi:hypothetical protein
MSIDKLSIKRRYVFQRVHANGHPSGPFLEVGDHEQRVPKGNAKRTGAGAWVLVLHQRIETINQLVEALLFLSFFGIVVVKRHRRASAHSTKCC